MDIKGSAGLQQQIFLDGMKTGLIEFKVRSSPYIDEQIKQKIASYTEREPDVLKMNLLQQRDILFMSLL